MARSIYNQYSPLCGFDDNLLCNPYIPDSCRDRHARNELDTLSPKLYASIVPNPASNSAAVVYFSNGSKVNKVDIYDQLGELTLTKTDPVNSGRLNIDVSGLLEGIYLVRFIADGNVLMSAKLVIMR